MALTLHLSPDCIQIPANGLFCPTCLNFTSVKELAAIPTNCLICKTRLEKVAAKEWVGGAPQQDYPHHVEIDCSTGLISYTRLTPTEVAEQKRVGEVAFRAREVERVKKEADLAILKEAAETNPAFAALLRQLGVKHGT